MKCTRPRKSYLENNFIERDIQSILIPLSAMQNLFFVSTYRISNNFIHPRNFAYFVLSFIGTSLFVSSQLIYLIKHNDIFNKHKFIFISLIFNCIIYIFGFIVFYLVNVFNSNNHVDLILKIQLVHRVLKRHKGNSLKKLRKGNWTSVMALLLGYVAVFVTHTLFMGIELELTKILYAMSLIYFDVSIAYSTNILKLITNCFKLWITELKSGNDAFTTVAHCKRMFITYLEILDALRIFKYVFQIPVLFRIIDCFAHSLIHMQIIIDLSKLYFIAANFSFISLAAQVFIFSWTLKNIILLSLFVKGCEKVYMMIPEIETTMCMIQDYGKKDSAQKDLIKNVRRANRVVFNKMSACGVVDVDALMALAIFNQLTIYTAVLLQFAFA